MAQDQFTAHQRYTIPVGSERILSLWFEKLRAGEEIVSVVVAELLTSDLALTAEAPNAAAITIFGRTVGIGQVVQFHAAGFLVANSPYGILVTATTDSSPAQVLPGKVLVDVIAAA